MMELESFSWEFAGEITSKCHADLSHLFILFLNAVDIQ